MSLSEQIDALPRDLIERIEARGFDREQLIAWAQRVGEDRDERNRLPGRVERVPAEQIAALPAAGSEEHRRLAALGTAALRRGELAVCVMAGGMATRMGGVVKALVEAADGHTFLDIRLAEAKRTRERLDSRQLPVWLMTSEATDRKIREAIDRSPHADEVATFEQFVSLRLTPEGTLFFDAEGQPSVYATGHGDLPDALRRSGLLERFHARGGRYVWISNIDNLGASIDPAVLGWHVDHGGPLTVELAEKQAGDKGGGPVLHDGAPVIAEYFRLPKSFDTDQIPVFNTNTFLASTHAIAKLDMDWTYLEVHKNKGDRTAVQFERLIGELTFTLEPQLLQVPREGQGNRFMPVKDMDALERLRPTFARIAAARMG